jgi:S-formylglutathione hydrolase FrmB
MFMKRLLALVTSLLLAGALVAPGVRADAAPFHDASGITVDSATQSDARTWHLIVESKSLSQPVRVNILLPEGYADGSANYPVLYLFHGTSGGADDWLDDGNAEAATDPYPMIVVMPDAGYDDDGGGWFTNWVDQQTALGASNWETFHIDELIPWVDANLRTIADRSGRAIAGLSQGGFGSFSYAARHPDLFSSAASFSGAPDIASNPVIEAAAATVVCGTASGLDQVEPYAMFGDPVLDRINWQGHNPANLVTNLRATDLELWTGNGVPGPLAPPSSATPGASFIEGMTHTSTLSFAQIARAHDVAYTLDDYGSGTHEWPYWTRDLTQYLAALGPLFAHPAAAPASVSYTSVDKDWTQWGWHAANERSQTLGWSGLTDATGAGFGYSGGPALVSTPAAYTPGATYTATGAGAAQQVVADSAGRLTVDVPGKTATVTISPEQG